MFPSNSFIRQFLFISFVIMFLTSCETIPTGEGAKEPAQGEQPSEPSSTTAEEGATGQNALTAYQGVDPMADIQINAEIKKVYRDVAKLNIDKKFQQALNLLGAVKTKYPQLSGPDYQIARIYFSQKKLDEALAAVELSLVNNARNYYSLNLKGVLQREKGLFQQAKETYLAAIEAYPPYPKSHLNLGVLADIYLRDSALALIQYQQYQTLTGQSDKTVANWIIEIERRIKAGG